MRRTNHGFDDRSEGQGRIQVDHHVPPPKSVKDNVDGVRHDVELSGIELVGESDVGFLRVIEYVNFGNHHLFANEWIDRWIAGACCRVFKSVQHYRNEDLRRWSFSLPDVRNFCEYLSFDVERLALHRGEKLELLGCYDDEFSNRQSELEVAYRCWESLVSARLFLCEKGVRGLIDA